MLKYLNFFYLLDIGNPAAAHEICIQQTDDMADGTIPPNSQMFRINRSNARFQYTHLRECCGNKGTYDARGNNVAASVSLGTINLFP